MSKILKPCPFCGGEAFYIKIMGNYEKPHEIYCSKCDGAITEGRSEKQVVTNWNTRPIEDALTARIAKLDGYIDQLIEVGNEITLVARDIYELDYESGEFTPIAEKWQALVKKRKEV